MKVFDTKKKHIIQYNNHLLSFLRFARSGSVVVSSCVASLVAIVVLLGSCVVTGVSGSVATDVVSVGTDSVVVVFVTTQYVF